MNPEQGLAKIERLVYPASAAVTFFGDDIKLLAAGDWEGMLALEGGYLRAWHPPTLKGVMAALHGPLGSGAVLALTGWGIQQAGQILGSGTVSNLGGVLRDGGKGVMAGGTADMLVRPTKYNSGEGAPSPTSGDAVMRKTAYYESTAKPTQASHIGFR